MDIKDKIKEIKLNRLLNSPIILELRKMKDEDKKWFNRNKRKRRNDIIDNLINGLIDNNLK